MTVSKARVGRLGTHYTTPGESNVVNDLAALKPILELDVAFEMVIVRNGSLRDTDRVLIRLEEVRRRTPGKGPTIAQPVTVRHGLLWWATLFAEDISLAQTSGRCRSY